MNKRLISIISLTVLASALLTGCKTDNVNIIANPYKATLGEELSTEISDYVRASKKMISEMTLDTSSVDIEKIGTYKCSVTYNGVENYFDIEVADRTAPIVNVKTNEVYFELSGTLRITDIVTSVNDYSEYEYGFSDDMTKSDKNKKMIESISFDEIGDYAAEIIAKDEYDNYSVTPITVHIVNEGEIPVGSLEITDFSPYMNTDKGESLNNLEAYNTEGEYYGVGNHAENTRPDVSYYANKYKNFCVDFIQPDSSFVWMTFNEITENGNTEKILDTLKEKEVLAVFFVTLSYAENNPQLIQRMIDEGHVIGNYTANCTVVPELSVNKLTSEIDKLYNYFYETYGYEMYLFRAPSGYFSEQSLAVAQSLGYRNVFWSFAYADWDADNQPNTDEALANALAKAHGGAIYALSGASSTNQKMMSDLIDGIREKGFEFAIYQKN